MSPFVCNHNGDCDEDRLCCLKTEMTLTQDDIRRIESLGYDRDEFVHRAQDGFYELRNIDGHCFFYDPSSKLCRIYEHRPEGCRYYPVVYDARADRCIVDEECPSRSTVSDDEIRRICHGVRTLIRTLVREARPVE